MGGEDRRSQRADEASLVGLLAGHAAASPERPFVFYPEGLDMRWRSYRTVAAQAAAGAAALASLGLAGGDRVAFLWRGGPDGVAADLAIQGAGLTSVPVADGEASGVIAEARPAAWLALPGGAAPAEPRVPVAELPAAVPEWGRGGRGGDLPAGPGAARAAGAAWVRRAGGGEAGAEPGARIEGQGALLAAARTLDGRVAACLAATAPSSLRRRPRREIALASFDLAEADGRTILSWALLSGAALVLEPDPRSLGGVAAWARPTLVAGPLRGLEALEQTGRRLEERRLARWARRLGRRAPGRPFGRLRTVVLLGTGRLGAASLSYWLERKVGVVRAR